MNLQEMISAVNRRIDDVADTSDVVEWLNEGKNVMAIAVKAKFPDLSALGSFSSQQFVFDSKYHGLPVLFASARFKEKDAVLQESQNYLTQFEELLKEFVMKYEVPPVYRDDHLTQQFTAIEDGQTVTVTKQTYSASYGDTKVYINGIETVNFSINDTGTITVTDALVGDYITVVWEEHQDFVEPPYSFWGRW